MNDNKIIEKQIKLLSKWNETHIDIEPEQVRRNCETIKLLIDAKKEEAPIMESEPQEFYFRKPYDKHFTKVYLVEAK